MFTRFIYWNSHFYGSNFYGWSIGDLKSLTESGPFHAQGITALVLVCISVEEIFQGEEGWPISPGSAPGMIMSPSLSLLVNSLGQ